MDENANGRTPAKRPGRSQQHPTVIATAKESNPRHTKSRSVMIFSSPWTTVAAGALAVVSGMVPMISHAVFGQVEVPVLPKNSDQVIAWAGIVAAVIIGLRGPVTAAYAGMRTEKRKQDGLDDEARERSTRHEKATLEYTIANLKAVLELREKSIEWYVDRLEARDRDVEERDREIDRLNKENERLRATPRTGGRRGPTEA